MDRMLTLTLPHTEHRRSNCHYQRLVPTSLTQLTEYILHNECMINSQLCEQHEMLNSGLPTAQTHCTAKCFLTCAITYNLPPTVFPSVTISIACLFWGNSLIVNLIIAVKAEFHSSAVLLQNHSRQNLTEEGHYIPLVIRDLSTAFILQMRL